MDTVLKKQTTSNFGVPPEDTNSNKWQKYSENTSIFSSSELVDHIAVYNYMFWPLSAIVRLYYFLFKVELHNMEGACYW